MAARFVSRRSVIVAGVAGMGSVLLAACGAAAPTPTTAPATPAAPAPTAAPAATTAPAPTTAPAAAPTTAPAAAPATPAAAKPATSAGGKTTIRYTYDETPGEKEWHGKVKPDYEKAHPNVELQPEPTVDKWVEKTIAGLVAGTAPDMLLSFGDIVSRFASRGAFVDVTEIAKGWGSDYDLNDVFPAALKESQVKAVQFALPYCYDPVSIFFFRKSAFDEAKLGYPDDKWTYDDFQKDNVALTKKDASGKVVQWAYNGAESIADWGYVRLYPAIWAFGGDKYNPDMTKCLLAEPEALKAINMYYDLKWKANSSPTPQDVGKLSYYQMFASGQCAMQTTGPWAISTYREMIKDEKIKNDWDVGPPPNGPKGRFVLAAANHWGINKDSKVRDATADLLRYLTDKDRAKELGKIGRRVPARKSGGGSFIDSNRPENQKVFPESLAYARSDQIHPAQEGKIADVLTAAWQQIILLNKGTPEQIMPDAVKKVDALLKEG
jgi:ABC-type glycerol-3-phosphate transport system substrate-binding protein